MAELLTKKIADEYRRKAALLPENGMQDIGERRLLRLELQNRCGITELKAINIINGFHIQEYVQEALLKEIERQKKEQEEKKKNERRAI